MIIGISGRIGSGKDTVGKIINWLIWKNNYYKDDDSVVFSNTWYSKGSDGGCFETKKFAEKLKQIVCILTGCRREDLENQEFKSKLLPDCWNYVIDESQRAVNISKYKDDEIFIADPERFTKKYTYRDLLQLIGTNALRDVIHEDIWINALFSDYNPIAGKLKNYPGTDIKSQLDAFPKWIITDVRFPNEAEAIRSRGGVILRVERPTDDLKATHASETSLDEYPFDSIIRNSGTIDELIESVKAALFHLEIKA